MSFSGNVKEELRSKYSKSRHCMLAELGGIVSTEGVIQGDFHNLVLSTDNIILIEKYATLVKEIFHFDISKPLGKGNCLKILEALKFDLDEIKKIVESSNNAACEIKGCIVNGMLIQQDCCKRAFLRGTFLAVGTVSDPNKSYHLELVCLNERQAKQVQKTIDFFKLDAKIVQRKNHHVVYLKEGSQVSDFLNIVEAYNSLLALENVRILKDMRNSVNRKVNCETANISKTVNAAVRQIEDIEFIIDTIGLDKIPKQLKDIAVVRMDNPDMSLKGLGDLLDPPVGKSGVNHRLRKISVIADDLRAKQCDI